MKICFLADENIASSVVSALREEGYDVRSVKEEDLLGVSDRNLILYAKGEGRIILTHDRDFGNLLNFPLQSHCGVVLICYSDKSAGNVADRLLNLLGSLKGRLRYSLVIATDDAVKIHKKHRL